MKFMMMPADWVCLECEQSGVPLDEGHSEICEECYPDWEASRNEAAYESFLSDFYGGSGPVTLDEQLAEAREIKAGRKG